MWLHCHQRFWAVNFCMFGKGVFVMALRIIEWREPGMHNLHEGLLIDSSTETIY